MSFFFALFGDLVELFVVGKRMRIRTRDVRVNQRGAAALAAVFDGFLADGVAFQRIGAVAFRDVQAGKAAHELRNAAAGGLHFHGNGDGVAVVFDQIEERQFFGAGGVERFPEFAFAGGAVAAGNVDDFVGLVCDVFAERRFLGLRAALSGDRS